MKYECPKCSQEIELTGQQLVEAGYATTCPRCGAPLKIMGDYAYIPTERTPLDEPESAPTPPPFRGEGMTSLDPLYDDAVAFVATCNAVHVGMLATYFNIEPERAARLMNELERGGVVGPYEPGRPRRILIPHSEQLPGIVMRTQELDEARRQLAEQGGPRGKTCSLSCGGLIFLLLAIYILVQILFK